MSHHDHDEQHKTLANLAGKFGTAMLASMDADGRLVARPMTPLGDAFDGGFWFATERDNPVVGQVKAQPMVNVSCMHEGDNHFLSISGKARIVTDREQIKRLWSKPMDAFFEGGPEDPNVCLVRVDAEQADYWDGPGNLLTKLAFFATVATTGNHEALSDSGTVKL